MHKTIFKSKCAAYSIYCHSNPSPYYPRHSTQHNTSFPINGLKLHTSLRLKNRLRLRFRLRKGLFVFYLTSTCFFSTCLFLTSTCFKLMARHSNSMPEIMERIMHAWRNRFHAIGNDHHCKCHCHNNKRRQQRPPQTLLSFNYSFHTLNPPFYFFATSLDNAA